MNRLILIQLLTVVSMSLPSGSPFCEINTRNYQVFQAEHGRQSKAIHFNATFKEENGAYKIRVSGNEPIHGVLLYVTGADMKTHLGQFSPKKGFKFIDDCSGPYGSTLTHSTSDMKKDTEFIWNKIPSESGPFTLHAIVTGDRMPWNMFSIAEESSITVSTHKGFRTEESQEQKMDASATKSDQTKSPTSMISNIYFSKANTDEPYESLILSLTFLGLLSVF